jgi:predicted DNA-binding transcriptional regulator YafY
MYNPTTRLLTILELLQARGSISGAELSQRLEVDIRSIRRYIMMLRDMGIPIDAERGREGAYMLRPGYRLPPLMFNEDEILAVITGLMVARKLSIADAAGAESAAAKIERVLPDELRQRVGALQNTLQFNMAEPDLAMSQVPSREIIGVLSLAAYQQRSAHITYTSLSSGRSERVIDPYGVVYHTGLWYTVGYCHLRSEIRVFRLDRIGQCTLQKETFERPGSFDPLAYVLESIATMPGGWRTEVLLKVPLFEARERIPPDLATLEAVEGGVVMTAHSASLPWLARFLVRTGIEFVILSPPELREELRRLADDILRLAEKQG